MSQPESKDNNNFDAERVYCTNALIKKIGGAVAVDVNDATLPGNARNKHMTILYRRSPRWTENEIELISKETDSWIKQKYGSNKAPITFSISKWGKKSVKVEGDLESLCLYLRQKFNDLSNDKQRVPHIELFVNARNGKGGRRNNKNNSDNCSPKKARKNGKKFGNNKSEKVREKLERMISKMQELRQKKMQEIQLLDEQEKQLQELLNNADNLDNKTLNNQIKNVAKSFKNKRKQFKNNNNKQRKKYEKKQFKQQRKEFNKKRKEQRKLEKEERKRLKKEKVEKLAMARLESLPSDKNEIGGNSTLYVYVDGYNVIGCDGMCRKNMRGRGGMKKARSRLAGLLQQNFLDTFGELKLDYNVAVNLWFDGNGKDEKYGDIQITFSTKKQIVDDKLVELFGKNNKKQNSNILVITTDKALTLRLYEIGCKVIKSSVFYKKYLKDKKEAVSASNPNDDGNDEEEKKEEFEQNTIDDDFVEVITKKWEDVDTPDGDSGDYDEGDCTPDEVEGGNDDNNYHQYQTPDNGDYEDYEFTQIFGEMDVIDFD